MMQQLKCRKNERWRPLSFGFTMPSEELDF